VPLFWLAVKFGEIGITKNLPKYKKFIGILPYISFIALLLGYLYLTLP